MKRVPCALILLSAVLTVLVLPSAALAADITHFRGKTASVEFYALDPATCITTSVTVFATESRTRNLQEPPANSASANVTVHQFNSCTWENLVCASGSFDLPDGAFDIDNNLTAASVTATAELYDICSGTNRSIDLAVTLAGAGELLRTNTRYSSQYPGYRVVYRHRGQSRDATAAGSLIVDGTPLPLENGNGYLTNATSGTITIDR